MWLTGIMRTLVSNNLLFSLPQKLSYSGSMFRCVVFTSVAFAGSINGGGLWVVHSNVHARLLIGGCRYERPQRGRYREFQQFGELLMWIILSFGLMRELMMWLSAHRGVRCGICGFFWPFGRRRGDNLFATANVSV